MKKIQYWLTGLLLLGVFVTPLAHADDHGDHDGDTEIHEDHRPEDEELRAQIVSIIESELPDLRNAGEENFYDVLLDMQERVEEVLMDLYPEDYEGYECEDEEDCEYEDYEDEMEFEDFASEKQFLINEIGEELDELDEIPNRDALESKINGLDGLTDEDEFFDALDTIWDEIDQYYDETYEECEDGDDCDYEDYDEDEYEFEDFASERDFLITEINEEVNEIDDESLQSEVTDGVQDLENIEDEESFWDAIESLWDKLDQYWDENFEDDEDEDEYEDDEDESEDEDDDEDPEDEDEDDEEDED